MNIRSLMTAAAILAAAGGPALAQQGHQTPHGQGMHGHAASGGSASHEMMQAMEKMNRDMMRDMTGDPDQDFARMMAVHHEGAVEMSRIFLKDGKDPELRRLAEKTIEDQGREIEQLENWLEKNPGQR